MSSRVLCRVSDCGAETNGYLCKACTAELERALAELPALCHEVSVLATKQARVYRANGGAGDEDDALAELDEEYAWRAARIPAHLRSSIGRITLPETALMVNEFARDLLTAASNSVVTWARHLVESRHAEWSRRVEGRGFVVVLRGEMPSTVNAVNVWLVANIAAVRFDEAGPVMHREILDLRRRMIRAVGRSPSRIYAGPCEAPLDDGQCKRPLYAWPARRRDDDGEPVRPDDDDSDAVICDGYRPPFDRSDGYDPTDHGCGAKHYRTDRRAWLLADLEDRLLPLSLWQDTLPGLLDGIQWPTNRSTWWRWAKLLPVKTVIDGVEFFRGGDVIDLCLRQQQRIRGNTARARRERIGA